MSKCYAVLEVESIDKCIETGEELIRGYEAHITALMEVR